jgi:hypothetical protein
MLLPEWCGPGWCVVYVFELWKARGSGVAWGASVIWIMLMCPVLMGWKIVVKKAKIRICGQQMRISDNMNVCMCYARMLHVYMYINMPSTSVTLDTSHAEMS